MAVYCSSCNRECSWENKTREGVQRCDECWNDYKKRIAETAKRIVGYHPSYDDHGVTFEWAEFEDFLEKIRQSPERCYLITDREIYESTA